jgi:hypothetical protein
MKAPVAILFFVSISFHLCAQVNAYARVTSISSTTISIGTSNETYGTFVTGMAVIVMQMQDNTIGSNTSNNSSFGTLSSIQSTGMYEVAYIASVSRTPGLSQMTISSPLANTYNINSNSSVQIISYPLLSSTNYSTTADISAVAWNGSIGGVVAFRVGGTLTLQHNITADNAGFRGGSTNSGNAGSCDATTYISSSNDNYANKGESIYKVSNTAYAAGRGRILNGGGGGNNHNAGGGGGSNASAGGDGGKGYNCVSSSGGLGGATLYSFIGPNRTFMGGGAGAGEANNNYTTAGGNGGGIVIISANQIQTTGTGPALRISANGQTASDVGNDGAGGGGAGGTVMLNVNSWNIASTKTLTISANGGSGGNVTDAAAHGGGGGGGQGAILYSTATPVTNITTRTLNGVGGRNYAGGTFADNGAGSDNVGIFNSSFALLPLKSISFKVKQLMNANILEWQMADDEEIMYYEVQRSYNGNNFETIGTVQKSGWEYSFTDHDAQQRNTFYRITMHGNAARAQYSNVVVIRHANTSLMSMTLMPNPVREHASLKIEAGRAVSATVRIINSLGVTVSVKDAILSKGENLISLPNITQLQTGVYQVVVNAANNSFAIKMLLNK